MRRASNRSPFVLLLGTLFAALGGCAPEPPLGRLPDGLTPEDLDVLLITLDTTRADRIGAWARAAGRGVARVPETPRLDAFAARGTRFDQAISVTPLTLPAHSTLMTGLVPAAHGVRDNGGYRLGDERTTLAELFAASGRRTGGFVSSFVLDGRWGIGQGFETYVDDFDLSKLGSASLGEIQRRGDETVANAKRWLSSVAGERFFCWVHLYDPHTPYAAPEPFAGRYPDEPYNAEIAWTDSLVGDLLDELDRLGLTRRTIVALIGDHGESLGEHGEAGHGYFVYEPSIHVPFALAAPYPKLAGRSVAAVVGQADLAPTLLELAGVATTHGTGLEPGQGRSLVPLVAGVADPAGAPPRGYFETFVPRLHFGWSELRGVRKGPWQFVEAPRAELYDLAADPGATTNLAESERRTLAELRAALAALDASVRPAQRSSAPVEEDDETLRALAALGYVGGQAADDGRSFRELADPKDRLALYNRLGKARDLAKGDRPGEAVPLLEAIVAEDPAVVDAWFTLGNARFRQREWEAAEAAYRETLARRPDHDWAAIGLADTYVARGRVDEAIVGYRHHLERDGGNAQIRYRLAQVLLDAGRDDEAEIEFAATLAAEPRTARAEVGRAVVAFRRHDVAGAHAALDRALAVDPKAKWAAYNRALLFEAEGRIADAIAAYRRELDFGNKSYRAWFNLGQLLASQGDDTGAIAAYRSAIEANGEAGPVRLFLARALLAAGDLDGAEREARRGLELEPAAPVSPLGHFVLADVLNRRGRVAEAAAEVERGRALEARFPRPAGDSG